MRIAPSLARPRYLVVSLGQAPRLWQIEDLVIESSICQRRGPDNRRTLYLLTHAMKIESMRWLRTKTIAWRRSSELG